ncbi:glycoside hydrolase domain-containing protein [Myroides sp.]|uniref:glycoside hydrolase domain-containing protein n=1 Tax=Myroides sp. TaxID=1874736 RepID=UPI003F33F6AC
MKKLILLFIITFYLSYGQKNNLSDKVNVFLGTSGDYGQLSPGASYPFSMLCISPETYPFNHSGYEYNAKEFNGVSHIRLQGVGCKGSGGNILIKPIKESNINTKLIKQRDKASPGYYQIDLANKIKAEYTVEHNYGIHRYSFTDNAQVFIDLSSSTNQAFLEADYVVSQHSISGKISSRTTCFEGVFHFYFNIDFQEGAKIRQIDKYKFIVDFKDLTPEIKIGFSSVNQDYAIKRTNQNLDFDKTRDKSKQKWNELLGAVKIKDNDNERQKLFYSLLYRTLQAPYLISEPDGYYTTISGQVKKADFDVYHGWALWDNYREIIPLYSIVYPKIYQNIVYSIANMYGFGKKNFATLNEPAPTVRTEHALVVLADAVNKGYSLNIDSIKQHLINEAEQLDFSSPDKALESCYDQWALSQILRSNNDSISAGYYLDKAKQYKDYWLKDFKDLTKPDVDKMQARGLYQGTIWQYRWFVPFDIKGLIELIGSKEEFESELDTFFNKHYYNHANQPDLQTSNLYNVTQSSYKSQKLIHDLLIGESIQFYFNDNSKGIDPFIGRIYKNQPQAFLRTMDDDLGTMSAWFVLRSLGFSAANVGSDKFYLNAPIFNQITIGDKLVIKNNNPQAYIDDLYVDQKEYQSNYISYKQLLNSKEIKYKTSNSPNKNWPLEPLWISNIRDNE